MIKYFFYASMLSSIYNGKKMIGKNGWKSGRKKLWGKMVGKKWWTKNDGNI